MNSSPCDSTYYVPLFYICGYCYVQTTALLKFNVSSFNIYTFCTHYLCSYICFSCSHHRQLFMNKYLAIKLNRLKDKQARFVSHKEFLTRCIAEELVPKGLEVTLEPTIGNPDQEFSDNWYSKQKQFSLSLMKDIVQFCDKTISKTGRDIKNTESSLKRNASQSHYHVIQTEINANEDSTRKVLQKRKFKNYNNVKYKPKSTNETKVQEEQEDLPHEKNRKTLYSDILKRKRSKIDLERKSSKTKISTATQRKTTIE